MVSRPVGGAVGILLFSDAVDRDDARSCRSLPLGSERCVFTRSEELTDSVLVRELDDEQVGGFPALQLQWSFIQSYKPTTCFGNERQGLGAIVLDRFEIVVSRSTMR